MFEGVFSEERAKGNAYLARAMRKSVDGVLVGGQ